MGKLIPIILAFVGLGGGLGAGIFLRPAPEIPVEGAEAHASEKSEEVPAEELPEYAKMNNQFVIPVVNDGHVAAMVILALSLEVAHGKTQDAYGREPKLRDAFLQILFDHANAGGFDGSFTDGSNLVLLRKALLESAKNILGDIVTDVLISDIARQDT